MNLKSQIESLLKITGIIILFLMFTIVGYSQVENIPAIHPVYPFLKNQEAKGILPHFSMSSVPISKSRIVESLSIIRRNAEELNQYEIKALELFEKEFEIVKRENAVVFYSKSDSNQVISDRFFSNDEKMFYFFKDSSDIISAIPLGNVDFSYIRSDTASGYAMMGNLGIRVHGSIGSNFGFYLQTTNGALLSGDRWVALNDNKLRQNIKFAELKSDFDFTESHVAVEMNWFRAVIGRQSRNLGSGLNQSVFVSNSCPPLDGIDLSANFSNFEYDFSIYNLLGVPDSSSIDVGFTSRIPSKLMSMHRFALKPEWGEFTFWEAVIYSERGIDLSYLNPFSFLKTLEHANRDRDNSLMGLDWTIRPFKGIQINGAFLLDDIIFSEIGSGYWSNKWAYNLSMAYSAKIGMIGVEYSRVEPYTFSHFNHLNSYTNDQMMIGSNLLPNSDMWSLLYRFYFLGNRYPWLIRIAYERHGDNIYDQQGNLVKNVGGDPLQVRRVEDAYYQPFLEGIRNDALIAEIEFGYEILRGFNLSFHGFARISDKGNSYQNFRIKFSYQDF